MDQSPYLSHRIPYSNVPYSAFGFLTLAILGPALPVGESELLLALFQRTLLP